MVFRKVGQIVMTLTSFGPFRYGSTNATLERDGQPVAVSKRGLLLLYSAKWKTISVAIYESSRRARPVKVGKNV